MTGCPQLMHPALDATDARALAEFYRELLGLAHRPGEEVPKQMHHDIRVSTARARRASRCTCWPTRPGTRSACW